MNDNYESAANEWELIIYCLRIMRDHHTETTILTELILINIT
jgi:wyosine [tRNA(Phe)-imidazoG37] synthetase (radical SAM superfamily)